LEECGNLSREELLRKSQIQQDLMQIYELEEDYWHQRGRENWLLKGDNNTEFFHHIANGHRRQRTIFSLQNGDEIIQGTPDLLNHATAFYKKLFGPQTSCCTRLRDEIWEESEKLSDFDRADMDREFSEEEIKSVIDQMESNKVVGPDGFPAEFYQSC
jgi:hypothetical protein